MADYCFVVEGPLPYKRRPIPTKGGKRRQMDPPGNKLDKARIRMMAACASPKTPLTGPVEMHMAIFFSMPEYFTPEMRARALARELRPTKSPDNTNVAKAIEDALNKFYYRDDSQIVTSYQDKYFGLFEHVEVIVREAVAAD